MRLSFILGLPLLGIGLVSSASAQDFDSGSDGSDGPLVFEAGLGTVQFDPAGLGLDADGDGVYHFTTITIGAGTGVWLVSGVLGIADGVPIHWLAQEDVTIDGALSLNGANGHGGGGPVDHAVPGAGGFYGGRGGTEDAPAAASGGGPSGAPVGVAACSAGHTTAIACGESESPSYGTPFLRPLIGGSGGSGGRFVSLDGRPVIGSGGGAGGGAILIASSTRITLTGLVSANGGAGGHWNVNGGTDGGAGSGGAIRLIARVVAGNGTVTVNGGASRIGAHASYGRIRVEANFRSRLLTYAPAGTARFGHPSDVFLPATAPSLRITHVGDVEVVPTPTGRLEVPDAVIDAVGPVPITVATQNIPPGTVVTLTIRAEDGEQIVVQTTPLAGDLANATATTEALPFQPTYTRLFVTAAW